MLVLHNPSKRFHRIIREYLAKQAELPFSYAEVGATNSELPPGYTINHTRKNIGSGRDVFDLASGAIATWRQLQLGWVDFWPQDAPMLAGVDIAVIGRTFGMSWLNACRVAYVVDEREQGTRFGYAHGTLPDHLAVGEERFLIEMDARETVWMDILSFSRPNALPAKIGYPLMRRAQKRFGREATERIRQVVKSELMIGSDTLDAGEQVAATA